MKDIKALFVSEEGRKLSRKEVYIKNGDKVRRGPGETALACSFPSQLCPSRPSPLQRDSCERDALKAPGYGSVKDVSEVVTPRFLCTGGVYPYVDANTCKGEVALWLCCKPSRPNSLLYSASLPQEILGVLSLFTRGAASFK